MAKVFKNMKDLERYLNKQIDTVLMNEVADEVTKTMINRIDEDVYAAYTPYSTDGITPHYERTYELKNEGNIIRFLMKNGVLAIENIRQENGVDIVERIEHGRGYDWGFRRNLDDEIGARPFIHNTREEIRKTGRHVLAMRKGLSRLGIKTM